MQHYCVGQKDDLDHWKTHLYTRILYLFLVWWHLPVLMVAARNLNRMDQLLHKLVSLNQIFLQVYEIPESKQDKPCHLLNLIHFHAPDLSYK